MNRFALSKFPYTTASGCEPIGSNTPWHGTFVSGCVLGNNSGTSLLASDAKLVGIRYNFDTPLSYAMIADSFTS